jgi:hypothetical protein
MFKHIRGENNPADIISKHWGYNCVWHMLRTICHVDGETVDSPGRKDKDVMAALDINTVLYGTHQCVVVRNPQQSAPESDVQRDRGVSAFWSEWIQLYEPRYTVKWCTRMVVKITRELTDTTRGRITVIDVLNHPCDKSTQQQVYQEPLARTTQPDHPVLEALFHASYTSRTDLFTLRRVDVEALTYIDTTVQPPIRKHIPMGNQTRLLAPQGFREFTKDKFKKEMNTSDWIFTTEDDINRYLLSSDYMYFNNSNGTSTVPGTAPGVTKPNSLIEAFKKSMKREPSQFKNFNDKRYWATWHLQFVATAQAQDLDDIINPNYVPTTQDDKDLFTLKQKYLFSIFTTILQTDEGKALVRNQQQLRTFDAQSIFAELHKYHTDSTQSELTATEIMQFITSFCLGKQPWKGKTTVSFIAYIWTPPGASKNIGI